MDFFEQLGKRLTDAGQSVAQQTKNLADVTQLNSAISDREKKISQLCLNIGQLYYEAHKNDTSAEFQEMIAEVNALYAEIAQNQEKIKQIKGVAKCPTCGADVPLNAAFCTACGTKLVQTDPSGAADGKVEAVHRCPKCHAVVADDDMFCTSCGTKLNKEGQDQ